MTEQLVKKRKKSIFTQQRIKERKIFMTKQSLSPPLEAIKIIVEIGLQEDAAAFDCTTSLLSEDLIINAVIIAKDRTVVSGTDAIKFAFGNSVKCDIFVSDGEVVQGETEIALLNGSARSILSSERTLLNILSQLSGIATTTRKYADKLDSNSKTIILDTRKTTPGLRTLEKYAVRCGGGHNHRITLADKIFIKDNHIAAAGSLKKLLHGRKLNDYLIIELEKLEQIEDALKYKPNRILLDNLSNENIEKAVALINGRAEIEVSGNITLERIPAISKLNVDYISVGALTHSAPAADFSLEIQR